MFEAGDVPVETRSSTRSRLLAANQARSSSRTRARSGAAASVLNFGHTIGHAIESAMEGLSGLYHGECVAARHAADVQRSRCAPACCAVLAGLRSANDVVGRTGGTGSSAAAAARQKIRSGDSVTVVTRARRWERLRLEKWTPVTAYRSGWRRILHEKHLRTVSITLTIAGESHGAALDGDRWTGLCHRDFWWMRRIIAAH